MNYKEEKKEIKSLSHLIENLFEVNDLKRFEKDEDKIKDFLKLVAYEESKGDYNDIEVKMKLIPKDLYDEVLFKIKKQFKGNYEAYFNSVKLYFDKFTLKDLVKCNIQEVEGYESLSTEGKRKLRRERKPILYHASVLLKLTGKNSAKYCSHSIFNEFKQSKVKEFEFIENSVVVSKDKKVFSLKKCVKTSDQSVAEKLNLLNVQERIASDKGWTWVFITLTLPGEYHPNPIKGKNRYNGVSPSDSAKLLNSNIKRVRSLLAKRGIKAGRDYHGCTSAEAHKDGVLHKHMLMFCSADKIEEIREAFQFTFGNMNEGSFRINDGKAKASTYVFKYVMKSLTSYDFEKFYQYKKEVAEDKKEVEEVKFIREEKNAVLNNAFRSFNFVRGFSFFGMENCLTKFRFLARNLKELQLPAQIEVLVKENDLYELLTQGILDMFENVYISENDSRTFVGCKFRGQHFLKRFFSLVRKALDIKQDRIDNSSKLASMRTKEISVLCGLVILNLNDSREGLRPSGNFNNYVRFEKLLIENLKNQQIS